jgi:hypothetical protein
MTKVLSHDDEVQNAGQQDSHRNVSDIFLSSKQVFLAENMAHFSLIAPKTITEKQ